eukprot:TRINITY_DN7880_c0_g1_i1.p1 TRINITY_DN7880_c0_g1~~TRINITY_DN7880_c0_g1_i1.p1  ORF type:complete len:714 (-),score=108.52 TRINITY_DN7880_c0_g1_i1:407-2515(-)
MACSLSDLFGCKCGIKTWNFARQVWRHSAAASVLLFTIAGIIVVLVSVRNRSPILEKDTSHGILPAIWRGAAALVIAPMAAMFLRRAGSAYLRDVATFLAVAWLGEFANCGVLFFLHHGFGAGPILLFLQFAGTAGNCCSICLLYKLQIDLILGLKKSILIPLGVKQVIRSLRVVALMFFLCLPFMVLANVGRLPLGQAHWSLLLLTILLVMSQVVHIALAMRSLRKVVRLATFAAREVSGIEAARQQQGLRTIWQQYFRLAGTWPLCILVQLLFAVLKGWVWPIPADIRIRIAEAMGSSTPFIEENMLMAIYQVAVCLLAVWSSDGFQGSLASSESKACAEFDRQKKWESSIQAYCLDGDKGWQDKVEELGHRGFTLAALLEFYCRLGKDVMTHFDPARHTTNDVVRQAIIPLSFESKDALAVQMMQGVPTRPSKMITHNWGNLFADLVAVIIADALGEFCYSKIAKLLSRDPQKIIDWLAESGQLHSTVWVCAFSVNQHLGICDRNMGNGKDTVTQLAYPLCTCQSPKFMNDSEPCRTDGNSVSCEMNKFDDMMAWLAATDKQFYQVIAVDREFVLFSRAWCVAEIAEAFGFGMDQRLILASAEHLERHKPKLKGMRVQDMKASRPEDVDIILAKIPDKEAFNELLQSLIFDRLLTNWDSLDIAEKLSLAGHMARWQTVAWDIGFRTDSEAVGDQSAVDV